MSLNVIEQAVVSFNPIQTGLKILQMMLKGMCIPVCINNIIFLGWVDASYPGESIGFLKLEPNDAGDFCLALSES